MQNDGDTKHQKGMRTFEKDIASKGGTLDDHGIVFETRKAETDAQESADIKPPEKNEKAEQHQPDSILTNKDDVFDVTGAFSGSGETGTIITDKRKKRRSLGGTLKRVLTGWTDNTKKMVGNKEQPKAEKGTKIAPARTRKETIQKASEGSVHAPQDDHRAVLEKIRTLDTDAQKITGRPYLLKEKGAETAPTWTHTKKDEGAPEKKADISAQKAKIEPGSEYRFVAPEVSEHSAFAQPNTQQKEAVTEQEQAPEQTQKPEPEKEHLVAPDKAASDKLRAATPLPPRRRSTPSPERKEKAKEQREKKKKKFNWWFLFQELGRVFGLKKKNETPKTVKTSEQENKETEPQNKQEPPVVETDPVAETLPETERLTETKKETSSAAATAKAIEPEPSNTPEAASSATPAREEAAPQTAFHDKAAATETRDTDVARRIETLKKEAEESSSAQKPSGMGWRTPLLIGVIVFAIVAGVGVSYLYVFTGDNAEMPNRPNPVVSFVATDSQTSVPLSEDRDALLRELRSATQNATEGIAQFYPIRREVNEQNATEEVPATTQEIMDVLAPRAPAPFLRSLRENMMFGAISTPEGNRPFFIMRSNVFDTAFAGMLDWEPYLSADLAPLFGTPVVRTFDENARTLDNATNAYFQDTVIENRGVRILYDETDRERIVYTFVGMETIVLTTDREALRRLLEALHGQN